MLYIYIYIYVVVELTLYYKKYYNSNDAYTWDSFQQIVSTANNIRFLYTKSFPSYVLNKILKT